MRSKVTKLYDHTKAEVPAELRLWRVSEEKIDEQLASLSRTHALESDVTEVRTGDSVVCRGESAVGRWNKPVLLFYPGSGLCEKVIEDALVGMKPGESRTVAASEGDVTLTVSRIVRREAHPIDDELVKLEKVEGVETVEGYRRWYRESTEKWNRDHDVGYLARHLMDEIGKHSEYEIDEAEELAWAEKVAEGMREADEANGTDPSIPDEGTEFLTEEQIKEKYIKQCRPYFRTSVVCVAITEQLGGPDAYRAELEREAKVYYHMDAEALLAKYPEDMLRDQIYQNAALNLLQKYSEKLLED